MIRPRFLASVGLAISILAACSGDRSAVEPATGEENRRALIIVDMQYDFCPGGALAVDEGDQIVGLINELQGEFDLVVATRDWHPADHGSFASNHSGKEPGEVIQLGGIDQVLWPDHCVQGSRGAELVAELDQSRIDHVFFKGEDPEIDSYSGFFDNGKRKATGLGDYLEQEGVSEVYVVGLATDYCVKFTALDSQELGFATTLIEDASRAVNLSPHDGEAAVQTLIDAGVNVVQSAEVLGTRGGSDD